MTAATRPGALSQARQLLEDYLTFYHEVQIPRHRFFDQVNNRVDDAALLVVSGPSRMGNHLLMSTLDSHPELPRVPGEDGFLHYSFQQANYDCQAFVASLSSPEWLKVATGLCVDGSYDRWRHLKECFERRTSDLPYAGVQVGESSNPLDYEGTVINVDYAAYEATLREYQADFLAARSYNQTLCTYLRALRQLDFDKEPKSFHFMLAHSGMRSELEWLCRTFSRLKILSSLRSFPSYCISHIRSRHGQVVMSPDLLRESWEHWYHKLIDLLYLKLTYPDKLGLVLFEDLTQEHERTCRALVEFLGVPYSDALETATVYGEKVRGNSWKSRKAEEAGTFYRPSMELEPEQVPERAAVIWEAARLVALR